MKNFYFLLIAIAIFSKADAQFIPVTSDANGNNSDGNYSRSHDLTHQSGYIPVELRGWNVVWVFNDVGNLHSQKYGADNNSIPESESSTSSKVETSLYPTPATDHLNFKFDRDLNSGMIIIFDAGGKIILTKNFSGTEATVPSSDFAPGFYFYQVSESSSLVATGKFVKD